MEAGFILAIAIVLVIGVIVGMLIAGKRKKNEESQGVLFVDCSDREYEPSLYLNATVPIDDIVSRKQVTFDVNIIK